MSRGDIIKAAFPGDYGKPRPAVVVQSNRISGMASVVLCPLTTEITDSAPIRVAVAPALHNGLRERSQIMVDKITAVSLTRCRERLGALEGSQLEQLDGALTLVLGLAD